MFDSNQSDPDKDQLGFTTQDDNLAEFPTMVTLMSKALQSDNSFGARNLAMATNVQNTATMTDIEARKASIERDANRRRVMWEEALRLARSGKYADALAVESELTSMGLTEAKHAFSEQDIKQIQEACAKAMNSELPPSPVAAADTPRRADRQTSNAELSDHAAEPSSLPPIELAEPAPVPSKGQRPMGIGGLARVSAIEAWGEEDPDLTTWIVDNPDIAMEVLGFTLANPERQMTDEGTEFSTAEDSSGRRVLIESRLDRSANDQLGTLVANLSASKSQVAVWLVSESLPEHARAIDWLNESSTCLFFLVKLEAVRIGDSEPAPILTSISGPAPQRVAN